MNNELYETINPKDLAFLTLMGAFTPVVENVRIVLEGVVDVCKEQQATEPEDEEAEIIASAMLAYWPVLRTQFITMMMEALPESISKEES